MSCDHPLDTEYLYPSDAVVLDLYEKPDGAIALRIGVPCPECEVTLELTTVVEEVGETDLEIPLEDTKEAYD